MTDDDLAERNHTLVRDMAAKLAGQYTSRGVLPVDAAIGLNYATFDLVRAIHNGDAHGAIEWMRTAADLMERHLLAEARGDG